MNIANKLSQHYDFTTICRVCLNENAETENIFSSAMSVMLRDLSFIKVELHDGLPETICDSCTAAVRSAYAFKQLCIKSDNFLRKLSEESKTKAIQTCIPSTYLQTNLICDGSNSTCENIEENHDETYECDTQDMDSEEVECYADLGLVVDNNTVEEAETTEKTIQPMFCVLCGYKFQDWTEKEEHMNNYHSDGHKCAKCKTTFTDAKLLKKHFKSNCSKNFICEFCGKTFYWKCDLVIHIRIHTGEKPLQCETCEKSFSNPKAYKTHRRIHTGEKPYECKTCGKRFSHASVLKTHKRIHTSERPYMCSYCHKTFVYRANLTIHIRSHTGERPYSCDVCKKAFSSSSTLSAHMKTHTGEKRFICSICGKKLARSGDLTVHMRTHTGEKPYSCTICQKRFRISSHLIEHMRAHTGDKDYECKFCGKAFVQPRTLRYHMQMHTGAKQYTCELCCRSFTYSSSLHSHKKNHHAKKIDHSQENPNCFPNNALNKEV